jgi:hypothetical protein
MALFQYRTVRRINTSYYTRLVENLSTLGIPESTLPAQFPRLHWTGHKHWIERHYPHLFVCTRCHIPRDAKTGRHPTKSLCHSCAAVYKHNPRYLTDLDLGDDEMSEMADERWEQTKVPGPALSPEVLESLQRQVDAKLGNTSTQRPTPTVDDIMAKIRRKQEKKALIESVAEPAPDESPVVVSNNEGARKEPA